MYLRVYANRLVCHLGCGCLAEENFPWVMVGCRPRGSACEWAVGLRPLTSHRPPPGGCSCLQSGVSDLVLSKAHFWFSADREQVRAMPGLDEALAGQERGLCPRFCSWRLLSSSKPTGLVCRAQAAVGVLVGANPWVLQKQVSSAHWLATLCCGWGREESPGWSGHGGRIWERNITVGWRAGSERQGEGWGVIPQL